MNIFRTALLMSLLTILFVFLGNFLGGQQGMILAFGFAVATNFFGYWFSDKLVLRKYRAQEVNPSQFPKLHSMVQQLSRKAELPMPKVYVVPSHSPNAFATGRNPKNAAVAVTNGILDLLDDEELAGVLAHELSHIKNRDILLGTLAATFAGAISVMSKFGTMLPRRSQTGRGRQSGSAVKSVGLALIAPFAALLIQMAISRTREFAADRGGAQLCGNPRWLARALLKLQRGVTARPMNAADPTSAHLFIFNPFRAGGLKNLFRTHPPTEERVARLEEMANEMRIAA